MKLEDKKNDLRIRRTYKLLFESMLSLLSEKSFEEISVTDICETAMIHRTTFYKHFEDKYQLLKFCIKEFQRMFSEQTSVDLENPNIAEYYLNILKNILEFITSDKNRSHFIALLRNNSNSISTIFHQTVIEDVVLKLEDAKKNGTNILVPIPLAAEFCTGAIISVIRWWLENNMPIPVDDVIDNTKLMLNSYRELVINT